MPPETVPEVAGPAVVAALAEGAHASAGKPVFIIAAGCREKIRSPSTGSPTSRRPHRFAAGQALGPDQWHPEPRDHAQPISRTRKMPSSAARPEPQPAARLGRNKPPPRGQHRQFEQPWQLCHGADGFGVSPRWTCAPSIRYIGNGYSFTEQVRGEVVPICVRRSIASSRVSSSDSSRCFAGASPNRIVYGCGQRVSLVQ